MAEGPIDSFMALPEAQRWNAVWHKLQSMKDVKEMGLYVHAVDLGLHTKYWKDWDARQQLVNKVEVLRATTELPAWIKLEEIRKTTEEIENISDEMQTNNDTQMKFLALVQKKVKEAGWK